MARFSLLSLALCASVGMTLAAPLPSDGTLEKRINHWGRGTWFNVGEGACGDYNVNSDSIVAISSSIFGSGGNCNQWIQVTNAATGQSAWGQTRDSCPGCGAGDLDMSPGLFQQLGSLDTGVLSISWHFENMDWSP